jgi:hypothetical protein
MRQLFWHASELLRGYDGNENPGPRRPCMNKREPKSAPSGISNRENHTAPQYLEDGGVITAGGLITKSYSAIVSKLNSVG